MKDNVKEIARKMARMSSSDLNDLSTALMQNGISATLYRFSPVNSMWDEEKTYNLFLRKTGYRKLLLVKTLKEELGIGLKEAKNIVDSAPCVVLENTTLERAESLKEALDECEAMTEIITI